MAKLGWPGAGDAELAGTRYDVATNIAGTEHAATKQRVAEQGVAEQGFAEQGGCWTTAGTPLAIICVY